MRSTISRLSSVAIALASFALAATAQTTLAPYLIEEAPLDTFYDEGAFSHDLYVDPGGTLYQTGRTGRYGFGVGDWPSNWPVHDIFSGRTRVGVDGVARADSLVPLQFKRYDSPQPVKNTISRLGEGYLYAYDYSRQKVTADGTILGAETQTSVLVHVRGDLTRAVDSMDYRPPAPTRQYDRWVYSQLVAEAGYPQGRRADGSPDDTVSYLFVERFVHGDDPATLSLRTYAVGEDGRARVAERTELRGFGSGEMVLGTYRLGGEVHVLASRRQRSRHGFDLFDGRVDPGTGERLGPWRRIGWEAQGTLLAPAYGTSGFALASMEGVPNDAAPGGYDWSPRVTAYDYGADAANWHRNTDAPDGTYWDIFSPPFPTIDDRRGVLVVRARARVPGAAVGDDAYVFDAGDLATGDSLWRTVLRMGDIGEDAAALFCNRVVATSQGYALAVRIHRTDAADGVTRATAAFLTLDSLGCFVPGCRDVSVVGEAAPVEELVLYPNPVPAGQTVTIRIGDGDPTISPNNGVADYAVHAATGAVLASGRATICSDGTLDLPTDGFVPGVYVVALRLGAGQRSSNVAFVVR